MSKPTAHKLSHYTKKDLHEIISKNYDEGRGVNEIGAMLGVSGTVISYHFPKRKYLKNKNMVAQPKFKVCKISYQRGYEAGKRADKKGILARIFGF